MNQPQLQRLRQPRWKPNPIVTKMNRLYRRQRLLALALDAASLVTLIAILTLLEYIRTGGFTK